MEPNQLVIILLLAISCNIDNIGVGLAYGARGIGIPLVSNLLIALLTAVGTGVCVVFGQKIVQFLPTEVAVILGAVLLIGMGVWVIWQEFKQKQQPSEVTPSILSEKEHVQMSWWQRLTAILQEPILADKDASGSIDVNESVLLSMALMLNNIPNGLSAGLLGMSVWVTAILVGLLSVVTFWVGIAMGRTVGVLWLGRHAGRIAGIMLIVIGLTEIALSLPK